MILNIDTMKSHLLGFSVPELTVLFPFPMLGLCRNECTTHVSFSCVHFFVSLIVGVSFCFVFDLSYLVFDHQVLLCLGVPFYFGRRQGSTLVKQPIHFNWFVLTGLFFQSLNCIANSAKGPRCSFWMRHNQEQGICSHTVGVFWENLPLPQLGHVA